VIAKQNPDSTQPSGQMPECKHPERKRRHDVGGDIMQKTHAMIT
jgi:hypothetical protein